MNHIEITVKDALGNIHKLTKEEICEIRSSLGWAVDQGVYESESVMERLLSILPSFCSVNEDVEDQLPRSQKEVYEEMYPGLESPTKK